MQRAASTHVVRRLFALLGALGGGVGSTFYQNGIALFTLSAKVERKVSALNASCSMNNVKAWTESEEQNVVVAQPRFAKLEISEDACKMQHVSQIMKDSDYCKIESNLKCNEEREDCEKAAYFGFNETEQYCENNNEAKRAAKECKMDAHRAK